MDIFTGDGIFLILRWIHFLAGITWLGILYYFNFVQVPFMAQAKPEVKAAVTTELLPRALWWFRWGAMVTVAVGWIMYFTKVAQFGGLGNFFATSYGVSITIGGVLGTIMWFNVWFIIWPNQKVIIAETKKAIESGGTPNVGKRPRQAFLASRTNTVLSFPMLFFMGAASHLTWGLAG